VIIDHRWTFSANKNGDLKAAVVAHCIAIYGAQHDSPSRLLKIADIDLVSAQTEGNQRHFSEACDHNIGKQTRIRSG
jgi:hypothetical protein